ncbi:MAG: carboxymuconolactone decarboxylase family protein [Gemmatimonadota bacterium]
MARLPPVDLDAVADAKLRAGFDDLAKRMGAVPENVLLLAHKPLYVELLRCVSDTIDAPTEIDPALKQLVELKVARLNSCDYSVDLLEGALLDKDVSDAKLHELDFYEESTLYDERERLALKLTEKMVFGAVDDSLFGDVRKEFSIVETLELVVTVALENFYSLVNRTLGLKPQGFRDQALARRAAQPS